MADYNRSEAYDLSLYGLPEIKSEAAPETERPAPQRQPVKTPSKGIEIRRSTINSAIRSVKLFVVCGVLISLLAALIFSNISLVRVNRDINDRQVEIKEAKAENTRLLMQLNSAVSAEKVDEYAAAVLGMSKLERYQITYYEDRDGDEVVIAGGKTVESSAEKAAE